MTKKIGVFIVVLVMAVAFWSNICIAEKVYNYRLQAAFIPGLNLATEAIAKDVEKMSNGRIKIKIFSAGELIGAFNILKAVKANTIDMAHTYGAFFPEMRTGNAENGLMFGWETIAQAEILYQKLGLKDLVAKEFEGAGVHYLGYIYEGPYNILSVEPIRSLDDLRKMKVRAPGPPGDYLNSIGVKTVYIPVEELYLGLSTHQIDAALYGAAMDYARMNLNEVAKYYNNTSFVNPLVASIIMNQKKWNELPEEFKAIMETAVNAARFVYQNESAYQECILLNTTFKDSVTSFSNSEKQEMRKAAIVNWEKSADNPVRKEAVEMVKKMLEMTGGLE